MFKNKKTFYLILTFVLMLTLLFGSVTPAYAAEVIDDNHSVVAAGEVIDDDVFMSGQIVTMDGTVKGDLFAFGETIEINGVVEGNAIVAGQDVIVNGEIKGSLFIAGYSLSTGASVGGSMYSAGNSLKIEDAGSVDGSVYFGGYTLRTDAETEIARNLYVGGYQANLSGVIARDVFAGVNVFQASGEIGRNVNLYIDTQSRVNIDDGVVAGTVEETTVQRPNETDLSIAVNPGEMRRAYLTNIVRERVGEFIGLLFIAAIFLWQAKAPFESYVAKLKAEPGSSLLWGFLSLILFPVLIVFGFLFAVVSTIMISIFTLGDLTGFMFSLTSTGIGAFILFVTFMSYLVGKIVVSYVVGEWLFAQVAPAVLENKYGTFWAVALGVFLFEIIRAVPFGAGWLVSLVVVSLGFGAILLVLYKRFGRKAVADATA